MDNEIRELLEINSENDVDKIVFKEKKKILIIINILMILGFILMAFKVLVPDLVIWVALLYHILVKTYKRKDVRDKIQVILDNSQPKETILEVLNFKGLTPKKIKRKQKWKKKRFLIFKFLATIFILLFLIDIKANLQSFSIRDILISVFLIFTTSLVYFDYTVKLRYLEVANLLNEGLTY
ncbi:MAG: hypothetical protein N4A40_13150 [Tissierellales bacterium]|jgi:hypothetical protein|nr:hypothetical protein [Tissierellales bacterium]